MNKKLLSRDEFRESVFKRDHHKCVNCGQAGLDSHHILERRLFSDYGYYLDNGATLCGSCHLDAERTTLSCDTLREKAGIKHVVLPEHLYSDNVYDKWGNIIRSNGSRVRGELFYDESVQKVLKEGNVLGLFEERVKYPRTFHLPYSPGLTDDDRIMPNTTCFDGQEVVVQLKLDGENTSMYRNYMHARSLDEESHPSRVKAKILHSQIAHEIPEHWRFIFENLYAKHSIHYTDLETYCYLISIWNDRNECLSWDDTLEYAALLDLIVAPQIYRGIFDRKAIDEAFAPHATFHEGYVVRLTNAFSYGAYKVSVAKFVRAGHVQTSHFWRFEKLIENKLKS